MKRLILFVFAIIVLASCNKDIDQMPVDPNGIISVKDKIEMPPEGGTVKFVISMEDDEWSIHHPSWVTVDSQQGRDCTYIITLTVKPYSVEEYWAILSDGDNKGDNYINNKKTDTDQHTRTGEIEFGTKTISIFQEKPYLKLEGLGVPIIDKYVKDSSATIFSHQFDWFQGENNENNQNSYYTGRYTITISSNIALDIIKGNLVIDSTPSKAPAAVRSESYAPGVTFSRYEILENTPWLLMKPMETEGSGVFKYEISPQKYNISDADMEECVITFSPHETLFKIKPIQVRLTHPHLTFTVDPEEITIDAARPGNKELPEPMLTVNAERPWRITKESHADNDWYSIDKKESHEPNLSGESVKIHVDENHTFDSRSTSISLGLDDDMGTGLESRIVKITQKPYKLSIFSKKDITKEIKSIWIPNDPTLEYADLTGDVESINNGDKYYIQGSYFVKSTGRWLADDVNDDWLILNDQTGDGDTTKNNPFSFRVAEQNMEFADRDCALTLRSDNDKTEVKKTITITQDRFHKDFSIGVEELTEKNEKELSTLGKSYAARFDCSGEWTVTADADWLTVKSDDGKSLSDGTHGITEFFVVTESDNLADEKRTTKLHFHSLRHGNNSDWAYTISQRGKIFELANKEQRNLTFEAYNPGTTNIEVHSSHPWTITCPDWVVIDNKSFNEDGSFAISVAPYFELLKERGEDENVILRCEALGREIRLTVRQNPFKWSWSPIPGTESQDNYVDIPAYVEKTNRNYGIRVESSAGWTTEWSELSENWIHATRNDSYVSFMITNNGTDRDRSAILDIVSDVKSHGIPNKQIKFTQAALVFDVQTSVFQNFEPIDDTDRSLTVMTNGDWSIAHDAGLEVTYNGKQVQANERYYEDGKDFYDLHVKAKTYSGSSSRNMNLTINSGIGSGSNFKESIRYTQNPYVWNPGLLSETELPALDPETRSFQFECWGGWKVSVDPDLAQLSTDGTTWHSQSLTGNNTKDSNKRENVTIKFYENIERSPRKVKIKVESTDFPTLNDDWTIPQAQFEFDDIDQKILVEALNPGKQHVKMDSKTMGKWKVEADGKPSWITLETSSGEKGETVYFTVTDNIDPKGRSANIVITSNKNETLQKIINVEQNPLTLNVDQLAPKFESSAAGTKTLTVTTEDNTWQIDNDSLKDDKDSTGKPWLTAMKSGNTIEVHVEANTGKKAVERKASFDVVCGRNKAIKQTVTVTQSK